MRAFIDTSSLMKKYIYESGSDELLSHIEKFSEIVISPTFFLEAISAITRRYREKDISLPDMKQIKKEMSIDYQYFSRVAWNDHLEKKSIELVEENMIRPLDSIQLAAGILSHSQQFITSDKKLHSIAKRHIKISIFI